MPDIDERQRMGEPAEDTLELEVAYEEVSYEEEVPGHTPGAAEGEDEEAPHRAHPWPDPDKTPGRAEG